MSQFENKKVSNAEKLKLSEEKYKELAEKAIVAQKKIGGGFLSRYEVVDPETKKIYISKEWNSSSGNIESEEDYPFLKEISEEESWFDENGFIKPEYK